MRIPYGMRTMIEEIERTHPSAGAEVRNPDGFGVWRTVAFDSEVTKAYQDLLDELIDARIESREVKAGKYVVNFVPDKRADDAKPFHLDQAYRVLTSPEATRIDELDPEAVDDNDEAREERRRQLQSMPVARLRRIYKRADGTPFTTEDKKRDIIDQVLVDQGF